ITSSPNLGTVPAKPSRTPARFSAGLFPSLPPLRSRAALFPYTTLFRSFDLAARPQPQPRRCDVPGRAAGRNVQPELQGSARANRSEEHTSELQSRSELVCRLLLEKKKCGRNLQATMSLLRSPERNTDV